MKIENIDFYKKILICNNSNINVFDDNVILKEFELYEKASLNWDNYECVSSLKHWRESHGSYEYPNIHPHHQKLINVVKTLNCNDICEIGAGAGVVSKYVYNLNNNINLTCIEGSDKHISQMKENFNKEINIIKPNIDVYSNIIKSLAQDIPLQNNIFDLVYTCTVLMHIPFLILPKTLMEIVRISKKYILHIENTNNEINAVVMGKQISNLNKFTLNYKQAYELLNVKTLINEIYKDPHNDCNFICYLGEKIK
jgi:ubiquinone/menaquinone biosynthesis C-methylase UbiE